MNRNLQKSIKYIACALICCACSDELLVEKPPHLLTADAIYRDLKGFDAGLNALYSEMRLEKSGLTSTVDGFFGMYLNGTDLFCSNTPDNNRGTSTLMAQWAALNDPNHIMVTNSFNWLYRIINASNTIINRAESENVNWEGNGAAASTNKNRVIAEAKTIRAWCYRHLSYLFGDVPLNLQESTGSTVRTDWNRTPLVEVRQQIIRDLIFAEQHVGVEPSLPGRTTKGAIQTYLAEMYLAQNKPDSALLWADRVVNTSSYRLITERYGVNRTRDGVPYMDMFYDGNCHREEGNTESLWTFNYEYNTVGGGRAMLRRVIASRYMSISVGGVLPFQITVARGGRPQSWIGITKFALDLYEPQDHRFSHHAMRKYMVLQNAQQNAPQPADNLPPGYQFGDTIHFNWSRPISPTYNSVHNWPWPKKIEGSDPFNPAADYQWNDIPYLRLAETYLLKAEAEFLLGRTADAAETLNIIRRRSNASDISASEVSLDFILDERGRELIAEEHRRYTLIRTGKWLERVRAHNLNGGQNVRERDVLFPIPQVVIDANLSVPMPQNPGY